MKWTFLMRKEMQVTEISSGVETAAATGFGQELRDLSGIRDAPTSVDVSALLVSKVPDGLLVRLPIIANNSAHVIWTSVTMDAKDIYLKFGIVQNQKIFVRSRKTVEVEWRIVGYADGMTLHVIRGFSPSESDLAILQPQLKQLCDYGKNFPG
ncbi:hypothetical protein RugamoR57_09830 [Duganella caerulea]|uniref:hypothetical protein n=1 Tax=Duganella caerulea TaxID=2885762 RepID=UPI0030EAA0D8